MNYIDPFRNLSETRIREPINRDNNEPLTRNDIIREDYRKELNKILLDSEADDQERLFFVSFLRDKCGWNEPQIANFIHNWTKWSDYDRAITTRQVNIIFEKKLDGRLKSFNSESSLAETQANARSGKVENIGFADKKKHFASVEFQYPEQKQKGGDKIPETVKCLSEIDNGNRWYTVSHKKGKFGTFFSLDSGQLVETMNGEKAKGKADRFMSIPHDSTIIDAIIKGLNQIKDIQVEKKK